MPTDLSKVKASLRAIAVQRPEILVMANFPLPRGVAPRRFRSCAAKRARFQYGGPVTRRHGQSLACRRGVSNRRIRSPARGGPLSPRMAKARDFPAGRGDEYG